MMQKTFRSLATAVLLLMLTATALASSRVTVRLDATSRHQHVTGFGGFVCSPQFGYNHMTTDEIKRVWGPTSVVGCNIMRLYIPIGRNAWSQSLQTARTAKQMGLIVFASPWGQPAEWKTNGTVNAKNSDGTTGKLKRENWADYAQYLEDYVQYLRKNGVELDAISIQNEPDWAATYAGCLWSASEIAEFVKTYGPGISCKVMAPETLAVSDSYVNALNKSDVLPGFDIYGGHQYGGIQSAYKQLAAKGKEIWMTEYLINWNEIENNTRNFDFSKDFFNFFRAINTCMVGDFNAWVHYAAKRYYGMLGDGQRGTTNGSVTKRGYIMAHFARFVTGMTRIDIHFGDAPLEGSAYLSASGDTVVAVVANANNEAVDITLDLPFYTKTGLTRVTTRQTSFVNTALTFEEETCRPQIELQAQSVTTLLFVRCRDRQPSDMTGKSVHFDRLDDMQATKSAFGTGYQLSGTTRTFDHSHALLSTRTNADGGYVALTDRFSQLVMQVSKVTSTMNLSSAKTTLTYVNAKGQVASHDYGDLDLSRGQNFALVFDLSPLTLTDGCRGLISMTNNNWSSTLSITFGDVYLTTSASALYAAELNGTYVDDDSYVLDYTADEACTSLDLSACKGTPSEFPWLQGSNRVVWLPKVTSVGGANLIHTDTCHVLTLSTEGGPFRPARPFQAGTISLTTTVEGLRLMMLPFSGVIPEGMKAYTIGDDLSLTQMRSIPAHTPVLVEGWGEAVFTGQGEVGYATSPLGNVFRGSYTGLSLYTGDYVLGRSGGEWGLVRLTQTSLLEPFGVYAQPASTDGFIKLDLAVTGIADHVAGAQSDHTPAYNLMGQRVQGRQRGIVVRNGRKYLNRL